MTSTPMRKDSADKALRKLSTLATEAKSVIELALCHGTVVVVAYRAERNSRGNVEPNATALHLAAAVSEAMRLRVDWLEVDMASLISEASADHTLHEHAYAPGVVLSVNSTARVLAQKLHLLGATLPPDATDERDAEFLLTRISVSAPGQIKHIYARVFPGIPLSEHAHQLIERAFHERLVAKS